MLPTLVFNLERRQDRLLEFHERYLYDYHTVERIDAIDGNALPGDTQDMFTAKLNIYEKGCFLSHRKA
jgi:GR25 family glycosyltransferase involved in LPS biosynthesis